jgi:low temperature requirement protein LtrA
MFVYASMRLLLALTFFVLRLLEKGDDDCVNKNKRRYMSFQSGINFAVFAIWICISLAPNPAVHDVLWVSSIAVDFFHAYLPHLVMKGHKMAQMIDAVPIDAGLYSERFGLFVIIAMGEVVVGCSQEEPPEVRGGLFRYGSAVPLTPLPKRRRSTRVISRTLTSSGPS